MVSETQNLYPKSKLKIRYLDNLDFDLKIKKKNEIYRNHLNIVVL